MLVILKRRPAMLAATVSACLFGLAACGDGSGELFGVHQPAAVLPGAYATGRPAAAAAAVGTSVDALSAAIGIEGAARVSGDIPAPVALAPLRALSRDLSYTGEAEAARKRLEASGRSPVLAATDEGRNAMAEAPAGPAPCDPADADLSGIMTNVPEGATPTPEAPVDEACLVAVAGETSTPATGEFSSLVDQVSFSDNSTFGYSFSSSEAPTAVFVQLQGADEHFVVPASALTVNGTTYSFNFFGPTPGTAVAQVVNELLALPDGITVIAFYGDATPEELLTPDFPGAADEGNWSAPSRIDLVAQPARSGVLQATLTWNTDADLDLYIEEPGPESALIYYASDYVTEYGGDLSPAGGLLDVDDTDGYGPENIFYTSAPSIAGTYKIWVDHFSGTSPSVYTLTITRYGVPQTYTGTLTSDGQSIPVEVTF